MITYHTLKEVPIRRIYETFAEAFSDYQVAVHSSYEDFLVVLAKNGYSGRISLGAFDDEKMVGFILNGLRTWKGKRSIYDLGTGVIPSMRKQGITSRMLSEMEGIMKAEKIEQYLLEVLKTNENAYRLYEKKGFQIQREFKCYEIRKEDFKFAKIAKDHQVCHVDSLDLSSPDFKYLQDFWNCPPSWQNSNDSLSVIKDQYHYSVVYDGSRIIGYGAIHKIKGDIGQLAVSPDYRSRGVGRSILSDLLQNTTAEEVRMVNVEDPSVQQFLTHLGFENFADQYEMLLTDAIVTERRILKCI